MLLILGTLEDCEKKSEIHNRLGKPGEMYKTKFLCEVVKYDWLRAALLDFILFFVL